MFKQAIERVLMSNRINDYGKVAPEIQSRLALVIVQGSIAPVRIPVAKILHIEVKMHYRRGPSGEQESSAPLPGAPAM